MDILSSFLASFFVLYSLVISLPLTYGQLVPAMFIFGDSVVDVGNNNQLATIIKANFPPYGRDFFNHRPTGRFTNGKLATDFVAEALSFTSYQPAYLSRQARGRNLLIGANFASASSGYLDATANLYHTVPLSRQLNNYKEYQGRVVGILGAANATSLFSSGIYLISAGSSDFVQNYYVNPLLHNTYTPEQFTNILMQNYEKFIEDLYGLGARRIGVTALPPIGCLPAAITLFGSGNDECVTRLNHDAVSFNTKLNSTSQRLQNRLSDLKLVVLDIYQPLYDIVTNPTQHGFSEARRGCCGTGLVETSILCNPFSSPTCTNASEYVFWDSFHPSEAANQILSDGLINAGLGLIS
ncbi:GDSL esterase/lipase [Morus notabilis]|uniref:GDSL esterase/lipase n=1 Tax=Morus notabilis TaxID=981085 RepID=W9RK61_9ROSA|nr:GDSL esterase/lipase At5g22810 [Morus notabilis]EXB81606.1 GDSL esterase/lipase [Morus notabilis]